MAEAYFQASQRRLGMLTHESSLVSIQCTFLTGVYLMSTMRIMAAWKVFVQAGTQCLAYLISNGYDSVGHGSVDATARSRQHETGNITQALRDRAAKLGDSLYWSCLKSEL
jgi:hypothetical protein